MANGKTTAASKLADKLTIPVLTKRVEASARMSGANHRGKQIDPRVADAEWDRIFVVHGLRNYGAPVQRAMRDSFMTAFWRGAARGLANPAVRLGRGADEIALAVNVVPRLTKERLLDDSGARVMELVIRRMSLSVDEAEQIAQEASRRDGGPASGKRVAEVFQELDRDAMDMNAAQRLERLGTAANPAEGALQYIATFPSEAEAERALKAWASQEGFIGGKVHLDNAGKHGPRGHWVMQGFLEDVGGGAHGDLPDGVRRVMLPPSLRATLRNPQSVTDRALRYRANANPPKGPKRCLFCGSTRNVEVGHLDGHEENNDRSNLAWNCRSCNTALGVAFKKLGIGRRTRQYNPEGGAKSLGQWVQAIQSLRGEGGVMEPAAALEMIRATPADDRSTFSLQAWRVRRKRYGPGGRRNPARLDISTSPAIQRALAKLTQEQRYEVVRHADRTYYAMLAEGFDSRKSAELSEVAALNKAHALALSRANPEDSAAALFEQFHGKPSERVEIVEESVHYHENLAALGRLVELKIKTPTRIKATLAFAEEGPDVATLASSEDGRQLFIVGGNQELDLRAIEMDGPEWVRDLMDVGELIEVTYHTAKGFHKFEPINYFHKLGEETGVKPRLLYDTRNKRLLIAGGQYEVKPEGIVN